MKKIVFSLLVFVSLVGLSACKKEKEVKNTNESSDVSMKQIDSSENSQDKTIESSDTTSSSKATKKDSVDVKELLNDFGDGYGNYDSINERNNKLKKVMTDECFKNNGLDFDSAVMMASRGSVTSIYQPIEGEKDQYAVLVDAEQNGSKIRILLLAKVTDGKVSEMTYNTVKQEY